MAFPGKAATFAPPMQRSAFLWLLGVLGTLSACSPKIGDSCTVHTDCSAAGDRLCDPTFPGGYCTIFNCEPSKCPSDSVCVAYNVSVAAAPGCNDPADNRLERTFCMASCSSDGDCRGGYVCADYSNPQSNPWDAEIVEYPGFNPRVCTIAVSSETPPAPTDRSNQVCEPPVDASFLPYPDSGVGGGVDASVDATSPGEPDATARDAAVRDGGDARARDGAP